MPSSAKATAGKPEKKTKTAAKPLVSARGDTKSGKKKILIIEDEKPLAHALELKMTHEGYETTVCSTGEEGLREALTGKHQLILLDLILPGIDGFTILQEMKAKKTKAVVIILSNLGQDEDRVKAKEFGAKDYLIKSNVPLSDIVKVVKAAI